MAEYLQEQGIRVVGCQQCQFLVPVNEWRFSNPIEEHFNACPDCPHMIAHMAKREQEKRRIAHMEREHERRQKEQAHLAKYLQLIHTLYSEHL